MNIANRRKIVQNKFLKIIMKDNKFVTNIAAIYNDENIRINEVVIDTGCSYSLITYNEIYIFMNEVQRLKAKEIAIRNNRCCISFGVETLRGVHIDLKNMSLDDMLKCTNLRTIESFNNIRIGGISVENKMLRFSYDNNCPSLIGMDILKDWDVHISKSLKTNETVLMACPLDSINEEYIKALTEEFGIGQQIIKNLTSKVDYSTLSAQFIANKIK